MAKKHWWDLAYKGAKSRGEDKKTKKPRKASKPFALGLDEKRRRKISKRKTKRQRREAGWKLG